MRLLAAGLGERDVRPARVDAAHRGGRLAVAHHEQAAHGESGGSRRAAAGVAAAGLPATGSVRADAGDQLGQSADGPRVVSGTKSSTWRQSGPHPDGERLLLKLAGPRIEPDQAPGLEDAAARAPARAARVAAVPAVADDDHDRPSRQPEAGVAPVELREARRRSGCRRTSPRPRSGRAPASGERPVRRGSRSASSAGSRRRRPLPGRRPRRRPATSPAAPASTAPSSPIRRRTRAAAAVGGSGRRRRAGSPRRRSGGIGAPSGGRRGVRRAGWGGPARPPLRGGRRSSVASWRTASSSSGPSRDRRFGQDLVRAVGGEHAPPPPGSLLLSGAVGIS